MAKKVLSLIAIVALILPGCASEKAWQEYHSSIDRQTEALIQFAQQRETERNRARTTMMSHYSTALAQATITPGASDDVLLAFAWGVEVARPVDKSLPVLPKIEAPDKTSDLWKSATPIIAMAMPFLYAIPWANNSGGTTYSATDNAKISIQSENSGSLNTAGNDQTLTNTDYRVNNEENCIECEGGSESGPGTDLEPTNPIAGGETCEESGGYFNSVNGRYYADEFFTCSCGSRAAGDC